MSYGHSDFAASRTFSRYVNKVPCEAVNPLGLPNGAGRMSQSLPTADSCDNYYQSPNRLSSNICCANRNQTHCFLGDTPNAVYYKSTWFSIIKNSHCSK